ncbi:sulfite reductase flavoprotein subunit alpha [Roseomonas sp. NAR14]|uniref:NADPH--hemoprotein reductase n=1 Tax=Roseomonas acroporae TaxID=2937791 RepID=A0A9X1Y7K0_9PROT|nr:sulfite reductase flavoprotein subunit alpha [Roseomonas acroporae]MCK8784552.1 sulfite reductase flavoprotein subunit alpha [Roseomonas acroporae]
MPPETRRLLLALLVLLLYAGFCLAVWAVRRWRRGGFRRPGRADRQPDLLVAYASQTGSAERLALGAARSLQGAGLNVAVAGFEALGPDTLRAARRALFVVSTTGEGDAPDHAIRFVRRTMAAAPDLSALGYGLLALGDRSYAQYCAFGRRLDAWLRERGATPLFERIEADRLDEPELRRWRESLAALAGIAPDEAGEAASEAGSSPGFSPWRLAARTLLNPGSLGRPVFLLSLAPVPGAAPGTMPDWEAGDIAEIRPRNAPAALAATLAALGLPEDADSTAALASRALPEQPGPLRGLAPAALADRLPLLAPREYSVASLPADGRLELIVRQAARPDGTPGLASGWLTAQLRIGETVPLRLRPNRGFHAPEPARPLLLIGNGTGLAGLRAHLRARERLGARRNWLVFGERQRAHDFLLRDELEGWRASGVLERLDLAFSRDQPERVYVQHRLREAAEALRGWVAEGAAILVCGSLEGMAGDVHAALESILGGSVVEEMRADGRYRRDVY